MKHLLLPLLLCIFISLNVSAENILRISTTTSTENSGLLAVLNPPFSRHYNVRLDVISVGTGKALRLGENGDVDLVFVHAPVAELAFVKAGYGVDRKAVMHNDFIIVGPGVDPVGIKGSTTAIQALQKLHESQTMFISRGDDSGTHKKEKSLWQTANVEPAGDWYIKAGQGMGAVLRMADEKQAYTLTDRGTFISYQDNFDLVVLYEGDDILFNPYHIIAVSPKLNKHVEYDLARKYIDYVTGPKGQQIIKDYQKAGQQLFYPDATK